MRSKKAFINILMSLLLQVITILCGLLIPRLIIQSFGSAVNGLISSITQFLGYITLLESGVGPVVKAALYKPISQKNNEEIEAILKSSQRFFKKIAYIFIIYIAILCLFLPAILGKQFDTWFTISLIVIISLSTFAEYFFGMTYKLYLEAEQKKYVISIIQISTYILNIIVVIVLIKIGANIQIVKLASVFIYILRPILQNIHIKRKYNVNYNDVKKEYNLKQKWDGLAQHIAAVAHNNTDITILTIFTNAKIVSVYSVYSLIITGIKNLILSFISGIDASFGSMIANGEKDHLKKSFSVYELFYFTIVTIIYTATLLLIIPFIQVYTKGITDVNYIVPAFAYIIVIAEMIWSLRQPYNELVKAAGHFKQTQVGAWIEVGTNIIISIILVIKFGMIGVTVGTLIAMIIRTIEFIIYTSKNMLSRSPLIAFKRFIIVAIQVIIIMILSKLIPGMSEISYIAWIIYAIEIVLLVSIVVLGTNVIIYRKDRKDLINLIKNVIKK